MKTVRVQYFAILREQSGVAEEVVSTRVNTLADLYAELQARHGFTLPGERLRVALGGEFADWSDPLTEGAQLVFIPPVAGG